MKAGGRSFRKVTGGARALTQWQRLLLPTAIIILVTRLREVFASQSVQRLELSGSDWLFAFLPDVLLLGAVLLLGSGLLRLLTARPSGVGGERLFVIAASGFLIAVGLLEAVGHFFLMTTGSVLDASVLQLVGSAGEVAPAVASELSPLRVVVLLLIVMGPVLLARTWRYQEPDATKRTGGVRLVVVGFALGLFAFASVGSQPVAWYQTAAGLLLPRADPLASYMSSTSLDHSAIEAPFEIRLVERQPADGGTDEGELARVDPQRPNVVFIVLESTGYRATSLAPNGPPTTPFLQGLAEHSVEATRMRTIIPHTTKSLVTMFCGIEPYIALRPAESYDGVLPTPCIANLLRSQGYRSWFLQSATGDFERRRDLVRNMGFDEVTALEDLDRAGYRRANYFGYEDWIMLPKLTSWLEENAVGQQQPHLLSILTVTPHHDYSPSGRFEPVTLDPEDNLRNRYLNAVLYVDRFVERVITLYQELGLYENSLFVIVGDHGEAFGEHGRFAHDDVIWNEGLHVPFIVHDGRSRLVPGKIKAKTSQLDILPTVVTALDLAIENGSLPGLDLLSDSSTTQQLLEDRNFYFSCVYDSSCMSIETETLKFIHHYQKQPDELYRVDADPSELSPLRLDGGVWRDTSRTDLPPVEQGEVEALRADMFDWYRHTMARYATRTAAKKSLLDSLPTPMYPVKASFGKAVELLGYDIGPATVPSEASSPADSESVALTLYFRATRDFPAARGTAKAERVAWTGNQHQLLERYAIDPGPLHHPVGQWRRGDIVRDRFEIKLPGSDLGLARSVRLSFWDGAKNLEPRLAPGEENALGAPTMVGDEIVLPIADATAVQPWAQWRLRSPPGSTPFVKTHSWKRLPLRRGMMPIRGFLNLHVDDGHWAHVLGWAGDDKARVQVDRVLAFHDGVPIGQSTPYAVRLDVPGYPRDTLLAIGFKFFGESRAAFLNGELEFVGFRGKRFAGRIAVQGLKKKPK